MHRDIDALNYPYIRVRSAEWLKQTLMIFPHVVRMIPTEEAPFDTPEIAEFCWTAGKRGALLRPANLRSLRVRSVQMQLIDQLQSLLDDPNLNFRARYGNSSARTYQGGRPMDDKSVWENRLSDQRSFQIHSSKMQDDLTSFLLREGLAWAPGVNYSHGLKYVEMHPSLGEAVMATLAYACAEDEGLQVVTEFPDLHGRLIQQPKEKILKACLDGVEDSGETSGQQIAEFIVYRRCDVSKLTAKSIAALKSERDSLSDFRVELEDLAKKLPRIMHSKSDLEGNSQGGESVWSHG